MSKEGSVAPKERVNIVYKPATGNAQEEVELPLKIMMLGDYTQRSDATLPEKKRHTKHQAYLKSLGSNFESHLNWIRTWPLWHEEKDVLLVHAGIQPGSTDLTAMPENVLLTIRTWDGLGHDLKSPQHPPWYECASYPKPVVFGHWAANGKVDLPGFKGLDTGCVYGKELTGWCPEEDRFVSFPAAKAYCPFRV
jgi:bis(5'-nucleosyl)-tetraphosphatase (symmetrical)